MSQLIGSSGFEFQSKDNFYLPSNGKMAKHIMHPNRIRSNWLEQTVYTSSIEPILLRDESEKIYYRERQLFIEQRLFGLLVWNFAWIHGIVSLWNPLEWNGVGVFVKWGQRYPRHYAAFKPSRTQCSNIGRKWMEGNPRLLWRKVSNWGSYDTTNWLF